MSRQERLLKARKRQENIESANHQLWELMEYYPFPITPDIVKQEVFCPRMRAMVLSILTNGGVDFFEES